MHQRNLRSDGLPRLSGFFQIFQSSGNGGDDKCGKGAILTLDSIFHLLHHIGRKADRLEGVQVVRELFERGVRVHILNMGLVENTLTGNLILTVMLAFAEYERGMIVERTQTGKAVARQDPNFKDGRPKKFTPEQIELALSLLAQGKTYRQITTMTGISNTTFY